MLTVSCLRKLAGEAAFARGKKYHEDGQVADVTDTENGFTAVVTGSKPYRMRVDHREDRVNFQCTCPVGDSGEFCKHLVAASLAWLDAKGGVKQPSPFHAVREWLDGQDAEVLAELLFEQALHDKSLLRRLGLKAARSSTGATIGGLRKLFDQAVSIRDFVPYEESHDLAYGLLGVIEDFEAAISKDAAGVIELCEHALQRVKHAIEHVDDSDGELTTVMGRIQEIHVRACAAAKPEPKQLARKLFNLELASEYGEFSDALETYAEALGAKGATEYERLAREAWNKLPALAPDTDSRSDRMRIDLYAPEGHEADRHTLTRIVEGIALRKGSLDALVEVFSKDLSDPHAFVKIIRACREHGRFDQALEWARKGAEAFKNERPTMLDGVLADELRRAGKHREATDIIWRMFTDRPSKAAFEQLQAFAGPLNDWDYWRDKAVGHLRKMLAKENGWAAMETRTLLVEIYLAENNVEAALAESEQACRWETLQKLAETCTKERPEEALKLYTRLVPEILNSTINAYNTPNHRYEQATGLMLAAAKIFKRLNRADEFTAWLNVIRTKYKPKRNLMKLLDGTSWP